MQIVKIRAWNIRDHVVDTSVLHAAPPTLDLLKRSILKGGYRAYCLNGREAIEKSEWYKRYLIGEKAYFYLEGSGAYTLSNIDAVDNELYFEKVNLPVGYKPWVFYSWQSDFGGSRSNISEALKEVVKTVNETRAPRTSLDLVDAPRPEAGAADITKEIRENIDKSLVCVFDITNIVKVSGQKSFPNPNVSFELGYALQRKSAEQIFIVKKKRAEFLPGADGAPFDYQNNRFFEYETPATMKAALGKAITEYLERIGHIDRLPGVRT